MFEHLFITSFLGGWYHSICWSSQFIFCSCQSTSFWCSGFGQGCCNICLGNILDWVASSLSFRVCSYGHINCWFCTSSQMSCSSNHHQPIITLCWPRLRIRKGWFKYHHPPMIRCSLIVCVIHGPAAPLNPLVSATFSSGSVGMLWKHANSMAFFISIKRYPFAPVSAKMVVGKLSPL